MTTLAQQHDCLLLDLDGTVYRGEQPTPGAREALSRAGVRQLFITNNASRSAHVVAARLHELGFDAIADDIVTSARAAACLLARQLGPGAAVLVVGTEALADELRAVGLAPVRSFRDDTAAVVQGHNPLTAWPDLAEAALAIRAGTLWVATNTDRTLPSARGLIPGNGSMVAALRSATGREPQVAGKPARSMIETALQKGHFDRPLMVGDRLDTDIAGANAAGIPSLVVLSGVSTAADVVHAEPAHRPTYLGRDLRALHVDPETCSIAAHSAWRLAIDGTSVTVHATGVDPGACDLALVRSVARTVWDAELGSGFTVRPGDDTAASALRRRGLLE